MCAAFNQEDDATTEARARAAWRSWLSALATNAEAAMAAAMTYESLDAASRDAWLDVLEQDAPGLGVPILALYAPLLSVERDDARRDRMGRALALGDEAGGAGEGEGATGGGAALGGSGSSSGPSSNPSPSPSSSVGLGLGVAKGVRALRGVGDDGTYVWVVVRGVYLDFVDVLVCVYDKGRGFVDVQHDPLRHLDEVAFETGAVVRGRAVEETPLRVVVEEMAHAILAERRADRAPPGELSRFAHLFDPDLDEGEGVEAVADDPGREDEGGPGR